MGNCMKTHKSSRQVMEEEEIEEFNESTKFDQKQTDHSINGKGSIKVKIVLTKEELELLLMKLKNDDNGASGKSCNLEDLLSEIEKARSGKGYSSWRPSLESIMEDVELDDRS